MDWLMNEYRAELNGTVHDFEERYLGEHESPGMYVAEHMQDRLAGANAEALELFHELDDLTDWEQIAERWHDRNKIDWIWDRDTCHVFSV